MSESIVNKVSGSGLISFDLEKYIPEGEILSFDLKDHLFMGLILKEKDFREALRNTDWSQYKNRNVALFCSADAVIPMCAYMLVASYLQPAAAEVFVGSPEELLKHLFLKKISSIDPQEFADQRVVVKGCGDAAIGPFAYAEITKVLQPVARSIMYGEPCSTVPIYKKK